MYPSLVNECVGVCVHAYIWGGEGREGGDAIRAKETEGEGEKGISE